MNISTVNKILLPALIIIASIFTTLCVTTDQWRLVTIGPAKLNVGLYHLCRDGNEKLNTLITFLVYDKPCIGLMELKDKFSDEGPTKIPETLEMHVASCVMFPFILLSSFVAIVTSLLSSLPFLKPKRQLLLLITVFGILTAAVLEITTGSLYRKDLFQQQEKLNNKVDKPFGEGFLENIGNTLVKENKFTSWFLDSAQKLGSGMLQAGEASVLTIVAGSVNLVLFGYACYILVSERRRNKSFTEGIPMY